MTLHLIRGKIHRRNTVEQLAVVGPDSLFIALLTAIFVGAVFTIQVAREFINFGAGNLVGGVLAVALTRELSPVLTAVILAGRVGSAFAAEIGTMRVTEQIDALLMLKTDPIDFFSHTSSFGLFINATNFDLAIPGYWNVGRLIIATNLYNLSDTVFLDSARNFLDLRDIISAMIKAACFGILIAIIGCSWGLTTTGGAKGVGQSTTTAVVTALLVIFISNFFLSWLMFQGAGNPSIRP
ncbi:Putative uncharacterized protein [Raphidiopsis brookii D9]|nr:Putative uncharacterized protein [Raphidiopsis brookii D9]